MNSIDKEKYFRKRVLGDILLLLPHIVTSVLKLREEIDEYGDDE